MYIYTTHGCYWSVAEQDQSMATLIYGNGMVLIEICAMHTMYVCMSMYMLAGGQDWDIMDCPVGGGIIDV